MEFQIFFIVLCGLAFLSGAPLNSYVLFIAGCRMERSASALWFLNRALSDFIFILCLPLRFVFIYVLHVDWARRLSSTITSLHMFSSAFLLTAISVDRCILAARPEWAQKHRTASLAFWVGLVTWALSAGFSLQYGDLWESLFPPASTSMNFRVDPGRVKATVAIHFIVGFLIPLALSLIPTFCIVLTASLGRNRLIQPLKILLGLILTFFLCWLPYHVFYFLWISAPNRLPFKVTESTLACVLAPVYFCSCLSPVFYLTMAEEFLRYRQCAHNSHTTDHSGLELTN